MPGKVRLEAEHIHVGDRFSLTLQRTVRLPQDGRDYPLTPSFGEFPVVGAEAFSDRLPGSWHVRDAFVIPIYEREALFLAFSASESKPNAVQVGVGGINAVSGEGWPAPPSANPQNYIVCPDQPWLDGIYALNGRVRQFVAAGRGRGDTVAEQLGGTEASALQIRVYEPQPGRFSDQMHAAERGRLDSIPDDLGVGAGGTMRQKIYPDPYGVETWNAEDYAEFYIYLVRPDLFRELTGREPPPASISAETYTRLNLPWFELDDKNAPALVAPSRLGEVETISKRERERGDCADEAGVDVSPDQIGRIRAPKKRNEQ